MGAWPALSASGRILDAGADASTSKGTLVTPSATLNTKGSWAQLVASTSIEANWFIASFRCIAPTAAFSFLVDIGVGAAASESVLIPNVCVSHGRVTAVSLDLAGDVIPFRVGIAAGTRVSARAQVNATTQPTLAVLLHLCAG